MGVCMRVNQIIMPPVNLNIGVTAMFPPSQVHDWLHRTTGNDGTTIRLTSSKAAGHTFTLSQQEDEVGHYIILEMGRQSFVY